MPQIQDEEPPSIMTLSPTHTHIKCIIRANACRRKCTEESPPHRDAKITAAVDAAKHRNCLITEKSIDLWHGSNHINYIRPHTQFQSFASHCPLHLDKPTLPPRPRCITVKVFSHLTGIRNHIHFTLE